MHRHATKCKACDKTAYLVDQLTVDEIVFHKSCLSAIIAKEPSREEQHHWSIMMWGLIQNGEFLEAVNVFERMQKSVIKPCKDALRALVAAYTNLGALLLGRGVHNLM
ncbi:hypothetical protein ZIOFF_020460 [Zingiber officinale]|uniref:Pentatricopeptide repeat-containing protein n=1 Tax=Zingiber officinale TaxID=94328 RepID=A0A8J5L7X7_ZINOF|nr:hypothetical protein ZIOFF_020460 [Zingiber officinale]